MHREFRRVRAVNPGGTQKVAYSGNYGGTNSNCMENVGETQIG